MAEPRDILAGAKTLDHNRRQPADLKQVANLATQLAGEIEKVSSTQKSLETERELLGTLREFLGKSNSLEEQRNETQKEKISRLELEGKLKTLENQVQTANKRLSTMERSSAKIDKELADERRLRMSAEEKAMVPPDLSGLASEVAKNVSPMLPRPKKGKWDFEIVRDDDGHIARVVARPSN